MIRLHRVLLLLAAAVLHYGCGPGPGAVAADAIPVPASAGSQSPNLAAGANGQLVLSWLEPGEPGEPGHHLRYSMLQDANWGTPVSVARGDNWFVNWADFPSVVPITDTLWAAHWLVRQPAGGYAYDVFLSVSRDGGGTWSEPVSPHDDGTPTEHGFVTLYPQDEGFGLVWLDGRNMASTGSSGSPHQGMTLRSATYTDDLTIGDETVVDDLICDCCQTDVAMTDAGPVAVYRDRTPDETRDIHVTRYVNGKWQPSHPVAEDGWTIGGCPVNGPVVEADGRRLAVAWFTAAEDRPRVRVARSNDGGRTFSPPVDVVDGETFGRVGLAMLSGGDVAVSWLCKESDDRAEVCLRRVTVDGKLGAVRVLGDGQPVSPLTVPQLARSGEHLFVAWTARHPEGAAIQSRRLPIASL